MLTEEVAEHLMFLEHDGDDDGVVKFEPLPDPLPTTDAEVNPVAARHARDAAAATRASLAAATSRLRPPPGTTSAPGCGTSPRS
jgi:hypothetical protein